MVAMGSFKFPTISRSVFQPFKFFEKNFTSPSSSNESPPPHRKISMYENEIHIS